MKKMITMSLVAAATTFAFGSTASQIADLQKQIDELKAQTTKLNKKTSKINAHDANDNIKWGVDLRTAIDSINYDMADGSTRENNSLMSLRLYLNMAFNPDENNIFKGQLSMNKAFGADFGDMNSNRAFGMGSMFDWTGNEALSDNSLKVKEAYWLYLGDSLFGSNIPWTFSIGRRPSIGGFLANFREDDESKSPLGHNINVEFDGLSAMIKLEDLTGISGMSFKICAGRGSTNATPMFNDSTPYANNDGLDNIDLAGFIFVPYNDGQFIVKTNWFKAFDLPGMEVDATGVPTGFKQYGDMQGAAISVLVDGLTEDGYLSDAKVFGSFAWSQTEPGAGQSMLGSPNDESGTSYWFGALLPVTDDGVFGMEYNHGSQYWRSFTYGEDTMIGSKLATRGDAYEAYFTYKINKALSAQVRYTKIDYDYMGSQGFFGNTSGNAMKIDDVKKGAAAYDAGYVTPETTMAKHMLPNIVESADDFRFYLRYRF
jgi:hypothetical protein